MKFDGVDRAEDLLGGEVGVAQEGLDALEVARAKDGVVNVSAGFVERLDGIVARGFACAEAADLREDIPHPMRGFAAGQNFR